MSGIRTPAGQPLAEHLWEIVGHESDRYGVRYASVEEGRIEALIAHATDTAGAEVDDEQPIVIEEKLRMILAVAARWEQTAGRGQVAADMVSSEALELALKWLCPLWPFC